LPEAARRRHLVRGVTGKKDPPVTIALGDVRRGDPGCDGQDLDLEIGNPGGHPHQLGGPLRGEGGGFVAVGSQAVDQEAPAVDGVDGQKRRLELRVLDKVQRRGAVCRPRPQIRFEKNVDALVHLFASDHGHAEAATHAALGAIGGNDVPRPHAALSTAAMVQQHRRHAYAILLAGRQLGGKAQLASLPLGRPA
jgi:hypothetical protein